MWGAVWVEVFPTCWREGVEDRAIPPDQPATHKTRTLPSIKGGWCLLSVGRVSCRHPRSGVLLRLRQGQGCEFRCGGDVPVTPLAALRSPNRPGLHLDRSPRNSSDPLGLPCEGPEAWPGPWVSRSVALSDQVTPLVLGESVQVL